jgi:hypothetical protein
MQYVRQFRFVYTHLRALKEVLFYAFRRNQLVLNAKSSGHECEDKSSPQI